MNIPRCLQHREVAAVTARATVVVGTAVLVCVKLDRTVDLQRREIRKHEQHKQRPHQALQTLLREIELANSTHKERANRFT